MQRQLERSVPLVLLIQRKCQGPVARGKAEPVCHSQPVNVNLN